jgi:hypothetical protein
MMKRLISEKLAISRMRRNANMSVRRSRRRRQRMPRRQSERLIQRRCAQRVRRYDIFDLRVVYAEEETCLCGDGIVRGYRGVGKAPKGGLWVR